MKARTWAARAAGAMALVCAVSVGAWAQMGPPGPPPPAPLIVPGRSIGKWTLDTKLVDLIEQNVAQATIVSPSNEFQKGLWYHEWHNPNPPLVVLTPYGSVNLIMLGTYDKSFKTPEGLGVGSTPQQITAVYNDAQITLRPGVGSETLIYNTVGIAFDLPYDALVKGYSVVERVYVFRIGQAALIWRVP